MYKQQGFILESSVTRYISDVHLFLTFFFMSWFAGILCQMNLPVIEIIGFHVGFISFLVFLILAQLSTYNFTFGTLTSFMHGLIISKYVEYMSSLYPELVIIASISTFIIFITTTVCARIFPTKNMMLFSGVMSILFQIYFVTFIFTMFYTIDIVIIFKLLISLTLSTMYIYYDTMKMYDNAIIINLSSTKERNKQIIKDSFRMFFNIVTLFLDILRLFEKIISNKSKK
jgi:hypothetical protein